MVSAKQIAFFDNLLEEKEFPPQAGTVEQLRTEFATLNKASASEWIEKALKLPEKGTVEEPISPPKF